MNPFHKLNFRPRRFFSLANEAGADHSAAIANAVTEVTAPDADGWMLLVPFGDWPNGPYIQRFDQAAAESIANSFNGALARVLRFFSKANAAINIYYGHPDHPEFAGQAGHEDQNIYGRVTGLQVRDNGLWGKVAWNDLGNELRANGKKLWFSPRLYGFLANAKAKIFQPVQMLSLGLVPKPQIPGAAANAAPEPQTENPEIQNPMNEQQLSELRVALGLANTATPAEVIAAAKKAQADLATANAAKTTADTALTTAKAEHTTALATANAGRDKDRKALAGFIVDKAVADGRVVAASRDAEIATLANAADFDKAAEAIGKREIVVKVNAATKDLRHRKGESLPSSKAQAAEAKFTDLVNARISKGEDRDTAWNAVKASEEGQKLWVDMSTKD